MTALDALRTVALAAMACACAFAAQAADPSMAPRGAALLSQQPAAVPAQARAVTGIAEVGDVRLKYWDTGGTGKVVVLLHPATGNLLGWIYQQPVLAQAGYRVIGYSRRGHAGSSTGPPDLPGTAADDLRGLLDFLNVEKAHLVGVAAGGIYATDFALSYPQRVLSLTVAGSLIAIGDADYMRSSGDLRPKSFNELPADFRELSPHYRAMDREGVSRWKEVERANLIDAAVSERSRQPPKNKLTLEALKSVSVPVLLLTGDADFYTPPAMLRQLAVAFGQARTAVILGAGHAVHWENPAAFNSELLDFLAAASR